MKALPRITLLTVGSTIAIMGNQDAGVFPQLNAEALLEVIPELGRLARIQGQIVAQMPSPHMTLSTVSLKAQAVTKAIFEVAEGVVITQGTDTLEETVFALELMLPAIGIPVVMTGAMRNPTLSEADGPANLLAAVRVAASSKKCDIGVVAEMDGQIHAPRFVRKIHTDWVSAFESKPLLLGEVIEARLNLLTKLPVLPSTHFVLNQQLAPVALLTPSLGDDGRLVDVIEPSGYQTLVIAGMGGGHIHPAMPERLTKLATNMPVVIASRVGGGATLTETYAYVVGEIVLAARGMLRACLLSPHKSRIALALILGPGASRVGVRDFFTFFDGG